MVLWWKKKKPEEAPAQPPAKSTAAAADAGKDPGVELAEEPQERQGWFSRLTAMRTFFSCRTSRTVNVLTIDASCCAGRGRARPSLKPDSRTLDHVTGSGGTAEYARLISKARLECLTQTGHLGSVTRAGACADIVHRFLADANKDSHHSAA